MLNATEAPKIQENPFLLVEEATQNIVDHAFYLTDQKRALSKEEYKQMLQENGWEGEDRKYLKIARIFEKFSRKDLAAIEPDTLLELAKHSKKYAPVIEQLLNTEEISQTKVRLLIKQFCKPRSKTQVEIDLPQLTSVQPLARGVRVVVVNDDVGWKGSHGIITDKHSDSKTEYWWVLLDSAVAQGLETKHLFKALRGIA